jgi:hypothetical protein
LRRALFDGRIQVDSRGANGWNKTENQARQNRGREGEA